MAWTATFGAWHLRKPRPYSCMLRGSRRGHARARPDTMATRHDGETSIPSLLVPIAGLWPEDLAGELARQRRGALDDARSVPRPRPRAGACLLRLRHH